MNDRNDQIQRLKKAIARTHRVEENLVMRNGPGAGDFVINDRRRLQAQLTALLEEGVSCTGCCAEPCQCSLQGG